MQTQVGLDMGKVNRNMIYNICGFSVVLVKGKFGGVLQNCSSSNRCRVLSDFTTVTVTVHGYNLLNND